MSRAVAKPDRGEREGHGEESARPTVTKGSVDFIGTSSPLNHSPISVNKKTGHGGGEEY